MSNIIQYSENIKQFIVDNLLFGNGSKLANDTRLIEKGIIDSTGYLN